jgi:hypothetical protein
MTRKRLAAVIAAIVVVRWLAAWHVTVAAAGLTLAVPALAIAAVVLLALAAAGTALVVYRVRAERDMVVAWQACQAAPRRPAGGRS